METPDIRWKQRFSNFRKALAQLKIILSKESLNHIEEQGLIQSFEYTFELAWNTIKDYYEFQGSSGIQGSRDAFRTAFNRGLISDGELWMEMIKSRSLTSHTYDESLASEVAHAIRKDYIGCFNNLEKELLKISNESH